MAALLEEWDETWDWPEGFPRARVYGEKDGKLCKLPEFLLNYRHPDEGAIHSIRRKPEAQP